MLCECNRNDDRNEPANTYTLFWIYLHELIYILNDMKKYVSFGQLSIFTAGFTLCFEHVILYD